MCVLDGDKGVYYNMFDKQGYRLDVHHVRALGTTWISSFFFSLLLLLLFGGRMFYVCARGTSLFRVVDKHTRARKSSFSLSLSVIVP